MRMRPTKKFLLALVLSGATLTALSYWARCSTASPLSAVDVGALLGQAESRGNANLAAKGRAHVSQDIPCIINDEYSVSCRREASEVYVPFSFLRKYFEVYGKLAYRDGKEVLDWQHSYSKVMVPQARYQHTGPFLWFENYNVAVRDRVKCISGLEGVPISTQWDPRGHLYPVQIAQFGLSHFSKNLSEPRPLVIVLDDGIRAQYGSWVASSKGKAGYTRFVDDTAQSHVVEFTTSGTAEDQGVAFALRKELYNLTLSVDLRVIFNGSLSVVLTAGGGGGKPSLYGVHYIMTDTHLAVDDRDIYYGIGTSRSWMHLTRDLGVDLVKGLSFGQHRTAARPRNLRVHSIVLRGHGLLDNLTLSSSAHEAHFFDAADWFVRRQDDAGGWPIKVTRRLSNGMLELEPGWYSAMAQGQAMSVLTRAFATTGKRDYLDAALRAVGPFRIRSESRGVMTTFLGKFVWYEEYPTVPSSFVLNGFIYSLFGLYDLKSTCGEGSSEELCRDAAKLFADGMVSLKRMLPLFDTGSGTVYDLRHFSLGVAPNLARWDYHTTHINQLLYLGTIDDDPAFGATAERWVQYMKGKRAPHN
uniref:heparosan-N-sulfate-glucuronate 5-epimerase n=1 Tax=Ixodes ricinus TaxID=34613 RepID=A0A147BGL5_IXORI